MSIIDTLITDRTGGYYNASDLNRVGQALNYIREELVNDCGFDLTWTAKTDWTVADEPNTEQMDSYIGYVEDCRSIVLAEPQTPESMNYLTVDKANDIEKILQNCETIIAKIRSAWIYSGQKTSGQGGII